MTLYKNVERELLEDEELERLEEEYRRANGQVDPAVEPVPEEKLKLSEKEEKEDGNWKKRYSDLQSFTDKRLNEAKTKEQELAEKNADLERRILELERSKDDTPETEEEAKEWVERYPDLARILKKIFRDEVRYVEADVHSLKENLAKEKEELEKQRAFQMVLKVHEDFAQLVESDDFKSWVMEQPAKRGRIGQSIFDALNSFDAEGAIEAVNLYKLDKKAVSPRQAQREVERETIRQVRTSRNSGPDNSGKQVFYESQVDSMPVRDYERLEAEIDLARREGRFIYDLSGAAR